MANIPYVSKFWESEKYSNQIILFYTHMGFVQEESKQESEKYAVLRSNSFR